MQRQEGCKPKTSLNYIAKTGDKNRPCSLGAEILKASGFDICPWSGAGNGLVLSWLEAGNARRSSCFLFSLFPSLPFPPLLSLSCQAAAWTVLYFECFKYIGTFFFAKEKIWFNTLLLIITFPHNPSCYFSADESTPITANLNSFFKWEFMSLYAKIKGCSISALPLSTRVVI